MNIFTILELDERERSKFAPLMFYFKNIELEDLLDLGGEQITDVTLPDHFLLMRAFVERIDLFVRERRTYSPSEVLRLKFLEESSIPKGANFQRIDLSLSSLRDSDLPRVAEVLVGCGRAEILDLSKNALGESSDCEVTYSSIKDLVDLKKYKYINISDCPLASYRHRALLARFPHCLIWISKYSLKGSVWKGLIPRELVAEIEAVHKAYYKRLTYLNWRL